MIKSILLTGLYFFSVMACAAQPRIYQTDALGNIQHHKPSATIQDDGRIIETDSLGYMRYHKQQLQLKGGKIYQTDSLGNIQYHKPLGVIKK